MDIEIDPTKDSSHYIFERRFLCMVPQLDITSREYIKHFGTPTTGDKKIDKELSRQWISTYKTIAEMATFYKDGVTVRISNSKDVETIYRYVEHHLARWAGVARVSVNNGHMPIEDLLLLDQFASAVHPYAIRNKATEVAINTFISHVDTNFINIDNIFGKPLEQLEKESKTVKNEDGEDVAQVEQRESYASAFMDRTRWR